MLVVVWCFLFVFLVVLLVLGLVFLFRSHPVLDFGVRIGPHSTFDSPMWDVHSCMV